MPPNGYFLCLSAAALGLREVRSPGQICHQRLLVGKGWGTAVQILGYLDMLHCLWDPD